MVIIQSAFANIMLAFHDLRTKLGLGSASLIELSVYAAMIDISRTNGRDDISIDELRQHSLLENIPKPSVYRAISNLQIAGKCAHIGSARSGKFALTDISSPSA